MTAPFWVYAFILPTPPLDATVYGERMVTIVLLQTAVLVAILTTENVKLLPMAFSTVIAKLAGLVLAVTWKLAPPALMVTVPEQLANATPAGVVLRALSANALMVAVVPKVNVTIPLESVLAKEVGEVKTVRSIQPTAPTTATVMVTVPPADVSVSPYSEKMIAAAKFALMHVTVTANV